jgi:hypothetical protein
MALIDQQLALMDRLEIGHPPMLAAILTDAARSMLSQFQQTRLPAAPDFMVLPQLTAALRDIWGEAIAGSAEIFFETFRDGFPVASKSIASDLLELFVASLRPQTAQQILATTQAQIRAMAAGGLTAGHFADEVYTSLLEKIPNISGLRALIITRTEVHAATQFAAWQLARRSLVPLAKVWNAVPDARTRDFGSLGRVSQFNHRVMDGRRTALNDAFAVPQLGGGSEYLLFPGDPRGSAGNVINCRCIQTFERA